MRMLSFVVIAALFGCVSNSTPPPDRRVTLSPELSDDVVITDFRCVKGAGGFLTLQANAVNNTGSEYPLQWKAQWLDSDGVEIESLVSTWNTLALQPFEVKGLKCTAPAPEAVDMRFYARKRP
ncbi:MAG: YcfL family protein [Kiritimatiellae bacterium]|nr:YcfL family protein [Kiritimatiellia bacterium]